MDYFDYIIVGAGSSGAVVASRIVEKKKYSVLLIEAGDTNNHPWLNIPIGVGKILTNPKFVWNYNTEPEPELFGRSIYWPRGKVLGGSSSINGMVYVRGAPHRYDQWRDGNNPGWGFEELLPYFKKLEDRPESDNKDRGKGGPIGVSSGNYQDKLSSSFYQACVDTGAEPNDDYNIKFEGVGWLQYSVKNGIRSSTSSYIKSIRKYKNFQIEIKSEVEKIIFDGNKAIGVLYKSNNILKKVTANAEVILAAGPINSPKILELSGIGDANLLKSFGIKPKYNLPGVGENLTDHLQTRFTYETNLKVTVNDILNNKFRGALSLLRYIFKRDGLMSIASATVQSIMKSDPSLTHPDLKVQLMLISGQNRYARNKKIGLDSFPGFSVGVFPIYPSSRGSTHIKSKKTSDSPVIKAGYLSDEKDRNLTVKGLRLVRKIMSQSSISKYIVREVRPGQNIQDDRELLNYARQNGQTSWHAISTCRMGKNKMDVVNHNLEVYGTQNLRVIDSSIMPNMPTSNTNVPSIVIGEKGADLILARAEK